MPLEAGDFDRAVIRFQGAVEELIPDLREAGEAAVAVSGGPDSIALLLLARSAFPGRVIALTVDHGLRPESAAEAAMVARLCERLGVPHRTLAVPGLGSGKANLQARAREARYRVMATACRDAGVPVLMTAHHADDQAETLLMRLARGSGIGGLSGIRAVREADGIRVVRPLLAFRKADLAAIVGAAGIEAVDDPSNRSPAYDRTAARKLLQGAGWLDPARLAAAAHNLAEAEAALAWTAREAWRGRTERCGNAILLDAEGLPGELVRRVVLMAVAEIDPAARPQGPEVDRLIARLRDKKASTLAGVRVNPGRKWQFGPAPPRRDRESS